MRSRRLQQVLGPCAGVSADKEGGTWRAPRLARQGMQVMQRGLFTSTFPLETCKELAVLQLGDLRLGHGHVGHASNDPRCSSKTTGSGWHQGRTGVAWVTLNLSVRAVALRGSQRRLLAQTCSDSASSRRGPAGNNFFNRKRATEHNRTHVNSCCGSCCDDDNIRSACVDRLSEASRPIRARKKRPVSNSSKQLTACRWGRGFAPNTTSHRCKAPGCVRCVSSGLKPRKLQVSKGGPRVGRW